MIVIFIYVIFCFIIGKYAKNKGKSFIINSFAALIFSPIIIGFILFLSDSNYKCDICKEEIKKDAKICKHCGHKF